MVYLDCGDYARAAEELRAVTHADPTDVEAWMALGVAERGAGKLDARRSSAYEKALAADPNGPGAADALYNLGVLHMDFKKEPQKARDALRRVPEERARQAPAPAPTRRRG